MRWLLWHNHGNQQHVQRIRGSVRPQHGGEPCAPCHLAGLADARGSVIAGSQRRARTKKELDIVFYHPAAVPVTPTAVPPPSGKGGNWGAASAKASEAPKGPGKPELPAGPAKGFSADATPPEPNIGKAGILAFKEQFASLAQDQSRRVSERCALRCRRRNGPGIITFCVDDQYAGIKWWHRCRLAEPQCGRWRRQRRWRWRHGRTAGLQVARAISSIAPIGGGDGRPKAHSGLGASRTDEEIQIVFDRYKSAFYRDYNRELRIIRPCKARWCCA